MQKLNYVNKWDSLDTAVDASMREYGWYKVHDFWKHDEINFQFRIGDAVDVTTWKRIAHELRESARWHAYGQLAQSQRHEFKGQTLPVYSKD